MQGSAYGDSLTGDSANNWLLGHSGNDTLYGLEGNDRLLGQNGNDVLYGNAGFDTLEGGSGMDTLNGGSGMDTLIGGEGNDTFHFAGSFGNDVISDFSVNAETLSFSTFTGFSEASDILSATSYSQGDAIITMQGFGVITISDINGTLTESNIDFI
jgi:Ca2+-binding RTX toxin-like protein